MKDYLNQLIEVGNLVAITTINGLYIGKITHIRFDDCPLDLVTCNPVYKLFNNAKDINNPKLRKQVYKDGLSVSNQRVIKVSGDLDIEGLWRDSSKLNKWIYLK